MNKKVTFFLEKKVSFLIITSWVAGAWFVPNVNNEGADQPRVLVQFYQRPMWLGLGFAYCKQQRCRSALVYLRRMISDFLEGWWGLVCAYCEKQRYRSALGYLRILISAFWGMLGLGLTPTLKN